jgi:hypothetical protein
MSMTDQVLIETLRSLPAEERAEVEDFVEFLAAKSKKRAAWDRSVDGAPPMKRVTSGSDYIANASAKSSRRCLRRMRRSV